MSGEGVLIVLGIGAVVVVAWAISQAHRRQEEEWESGVDKMDASPEPEPEPARSLSIGKAIRSISGEDEKFSQPVFEDFAYALFTEVHLARGSKKVGVLSPYLAKEAKDALRERAVDGLSEVIVGAMRVGDVEADADTRIVKATLLFTANYTEGKGAAAQAYFVEEQWTLEKSADISSRPPDRARIIDCPSCGAPLEKLISNKCRYCSAETANQSFDWRVTSITETSRENRGPILTGTTEEVGTDDPTVIADDARRNLTRLGSRDPEFSWAGFEARVQAVFTAFHAAWSAQDLKGVRPFLSDALFDTQRYWVDTYKAQGLRNVTEDATIVSFDMSRVSSDAYFDAITVRVFAECKDYTLDSKDEVVAGSRSSIRRYSEYWTLIRSRSVTGAARTDGDCPNCGAPADGINMAGNCGSCKAKISMGQFDWVLSRIEQDEVFTL